MNNGTTEQPERWRLLAPDDIIRLLPSATGAIADVGSGEGFFVTALRRRFPVEMIAVEPNRDALKRLGHAKRLVRIQASGYALPIRSAALAGMTMTFVIHELEDRNGILREIYRTLSADGWLAIVEYVPQPPPPDRPAPKRVSPVEMLDLVGNAGFVNAEVYDLPGPSYLVVARRQA